MVAETRERMTEFVESWSENVRAAMDAGRRSQESVFKSVGEMFKSQPEFDGWYGRAERYWRDVVPFVGKNLRSWTDCLDTALRSGVDVMRTTCDAATSACTEEGDVYRRTRQVWDAAFEAAMTNFDAFGKCSTRAMDNWGEFFRSTFRPENAPKAAAPKAAK